MFRRFTLVLGAMLLTTCAREAASPAPEVAIYPGDPRNDPRLLEALEKAGKLR